MFLNKKYEIVVFGESDPISYSLIKKYNCYFIKNVSRSNFKKINLFFLLRIFFSKVCIKSFFQDDFLVSYTLSILLYFKPKLCLTFLDNHIKFYRLKSYIDDIYFVSIQNGARHKLYDLFGHPEINKKNLYADAILAFGNNIKKEYVKYINSTVITAGCYRNNKYCINRLKKKRILFISQFRGHDEKTFINHFGTRVITWGEFNNILYKLLPLVLEYAYKNKLKFCILGSDPRSDLEIKYYKKILGFSKHWEYIHSKSNANSYRVVDCSEIIVNIWSTLGYESLSRGNKTAFFRNKNFGFFDDRSFGWPGKYQESGKFYTSKINKKNIFEILGYLTRVKKSEWKMESLRFQKDILTYRYQSDFINTILDKKLYQSS